MGMVGEVNANANAEHLEKILLLSMEKHKFVQEFAKDHLYMWYINECGEAWKSENEKIKKFYGGK